MVAVSFFTFVFSPIFLIRGRRMYDLNYAAAISTQIEVLSKTILSSISALHLPDTKNNGKDKKHIGKPTLLVDSIDISILLLMHIVSSTKLLKEIVVKKHQKQESTVNTHHLYSTLLMPCLNSFISSYGKVVMDSFSNTEQAYSVNATPDSGEISLIGRHILSQFPDMASKKHKSSGKLLLHHAVYKYKHSVTNSAALDTVKLILKIAPESARSLDTSGALPLHWAMRNTDASQELIEILVSANPESVQTADNNGYLPLHLAVNMEQPNLETVRKLLALYPEAAAMHTLPEISSGDSRTGGGLLPLHLCVNRENPSLPVIRALVDIFPDAVKTPTSGMQGYLPLHLCVNRDRPHFEAVALLVALYPDGVRSVNSSNQTALHRLLENLQPSSGESGGEVLRYILDRDSSVLQIRAEVDGCLPLHLLLDSAHPNYALAEHMLVLYPDAAKISNNDGLLPMHVLLSAADNPPLSFVRSLLQSNRECLGSWVTDIVPASTGTGNKHGNASGWEVATSSGMSSSGKSKSTIDLELWSGDWYERRWSPLLRAKERELHEVVQLFTTTLIEQFGVSAEEVSAFVADPFAVVDIESERKQHQQQPEDRRSSSVHSFSSKSDAKRVVPGSSSSMSVRKPSQYQLQQQPVRNNRDDESVDSDLDGNRLQQDSLSLSADSALSGGSYPDRDRRVLKQSNLMATYPPPDGKYMPPHIISAKKRMTPMMDNLFSTTTPNPATGLSSVEGVGSATRPSYQPPAGAPPSMKMQSGGFRPGGAGGSMAARAPLPSSPIPATLLQVAESSALRYIKESNRDEIMRAPSASSSKDVSPLRSVQAPAGGAPPSALPLPSSPAPTMSIAAVMSLSRPISRPVSRPGSGYRAKEEGRPSSGNRSALNAAASLLMGDAATNSARRSEEEGKVVDGSANVKSKVKPGGSIPSTINATSLSMLKNHSGKKVHPTVVSSVDNVV